MRHDHFSMLPEQAFRKGWHRPLTLEGGGKGSAPEAPDYTAAAQATAQGNLEAARAAAAANRVNQVTPYGNLTYTHNPSKTVDTAGYQAAMDKYNKDFAAYEKARTSGNGTGKNSSSAGVGVFDFGGAGKYDRSSTPLSAPLKPTLEQFTTYNPDDGWTATQTLSPEQQAIYDKTTAITNSLLGTANTGLSFVDKTLSNGGKLDESKLTQIRDSGIEGMSVQDAIMSRLNPQMAQQEASLRSRLAAQGIQAGSEAYNNAMTQFTQGRNDLYTQAALQGINTSLQARAQDATLRQQGIQEQYAAQDRPLNIVNALRTGAQVQSPNFVNVPQQATTQGADLLGAATAKGNYNMSKYQSDQQANSGLWNALGTVGSAFFL